MQLKPTDDSLGRDERSIGSQQPLLILHPTYASVHYMQLTMGSWDSHIQF